MKKEKISKKQFDVLDVIKKQTAKTGYPPTVREICKIIGVSSSATVFFHMKKLAEGGYIELGNKKNRAYKLLVENEYIENNEKVVSVPLLGKVQAGNPIEAIEMPDEFFHIPQELIPRGKNVFTLKVSGESMINVGIYDGDILIVEKKDTANNGETVVAYTDDYKVTVKTFYKEKDHIRLQPENDTMEAIILPNCKILGKVIGLYRKL